MNTNTYSVVTEGLTKKYRSYKKESGFLGSVKSIFHREYQEKIAVNSFDLKIPKGKIVGLLGPNGAGKTTLMKMFTGIIVPSHGEIKIAGHSPSKREIDFRKKIALVMGQKSQLWWDIPAMDSFELLQRYYELDHAYFKKRISEMAELLNVTSLLNTHIRKLSLGERMKMELMASLLHKPEVLFLDEPTIGLDLVAQENIRAFIKNYHEKNESTIIVTSHYMADVQELCEDIVLIFNGKKGFDGPLEKFETILGNEKSLNFTFSEPIVHTSDLLSGLDPKWNGSRTSLNLRVPESRLIEVTEHILKEYRPIEFGTEKTPIERVMKTLMESPEILNEKNS